MKRILVTGAGGGVGQGIIKSLRRIRDLDVEIVAADMSPLAAGLYAGDVATLVPAAKSPDYGDAIVDICRSHHIDYYLPGTDEELPFTSKNAARIESEVGTVLFICPPEAIAIADDKYLTYRFLTQHGFPAPNTWLPGEIDPDDVTYPVIVKPRNGFRSIGVTTIETPDALRERLKWNDQPVIQELVATRDDEYTCTIAATGGTLSCVLPLRRVLRSGDTYRASPVHHAGIEALVTDVARALGVCGSCNFQLRLDGDVPKIFEINSRFSGTTPLCAELGFNPAEFLIKTHLGMPYEPSIRYDVTVLRHWAEMIVPNSKLDQLAADGSLRPGVPETVDLGDR
ncbi:MAG: ATP-grasp domain-containing protein [Myxococcales bacterium]|nr:ATP-grasp domain-containing protein [Myxococcales bacterium]